MLGLGEINTAAVSTAFAHALLLSLALLLALLIDRVWGEPAKRWHPVVWMGLYLNWAQRFVAPLALPVTQSLPSDSPPHWKAFLLGAVFWLTGAVVVVALTVVMQALLLQAPALLAAVAFGLLLKPLLAWQMLQDEVQAVEFALQNSLLAGQERLAFLVSRDVSLLSESQVRESAIESLAENLNDSVVSPILWFVLAGLPGAALYRFANTADAMWGYRGERGGRVWEWAGKWAARADDVLSWPGARITVLVVVVLVKMRFVRLPEQAASQNLYPAIARMAALTPSPNSGWPMAAFALVLHTRLTKPGVYALNATAAAPKTWHVMQALLLAKKVLITLIFIALIAMNFIAITWQAKGF